MKDNHGNALTIGITVIAFIVLLAIGLNIANTALNSADIATTSQLNTTFQAIGTNADNVVDMTWMYLLGVAGFGVLALFYGLTKQ